MNNEFPQCEFDYENVKAICSKCGKLNIFNRVTDLNTTECISSYDKKCNYCDNIIQLGGDFINPAYQMIFYKSYTHKNSKEYMQAIITLCTAYEMFFMFTLRLYLTVKPLMTLESAYDIKNGNNKLNELLEHKIKNYTFNKMLNEFVKLLVYYDSSPINTQIDSENYISKMNGKPINIEKIKIINNTSLRNLLIVLYKLKEKHLLIDTIRNKVAHKQGYRPSLQEVEREIKIAKHIIFKITNILYFITDEVFVYYKMHKIKYGG